MKLSNELKVGLALIAAVLVFYVGVRFFQDIPLFRGSYDLETAFDDAGGLVSGSAVQISGVRVGAVEQVFLRAGSDLAYVAFRVDRGVVIPKGSTTRVSGIAALGSVQMEIRLQPGDSTAYQEGDFIPSLTEGGLGDLLDRAPELVGRVDTLLAQASAAAVGARTLLNDPNSELAQTLSAIQGSANALSGLLRTEQDRLGRVLAGVDTVMGNLGQVTGDSLRQTVEGLNRVLARLDRNLAALENTTAGLDAVIGRIDRGEGTLGLLVNDPGLYLRLDSTLANVNRILLDFERNPKRYLKDLKLVDVF